ncbi:MAG: hypothetical protein HQL09_01120 [Nitrospirae bacterium]|nr:hypothetical protein [Nitrospirota bacterium]
MVNGTARRETGFAKVQPGALKCPYLTRWLIYTCQAGEDPYVPSLFQLEEYCKSKQHKKCPFV